MKIHLSDLRILINEIIESLDEKKSINPTYLKGSPEKKKREKEIKSRAKKDSGFDKKYSIDYPMTLPSVEKKRFEDLASSDGNAWYIAGDDGAYFNHSSNPNVIVIKNNGPSATWDRVAAKDINPGEELTMDYGDIGIDPI
jgi:SET domain-containing protein